jgi:hypothetical protein
MRLEARRKLARDTKIAMLFKRISDEHMIAKIDLAIAGPTIALLDFQGDEFIER